MSGNDRPPQSQQESLRAAFTARHAAQRGSAGAGAATGGSRADADVRPIPAVPAYSPWYAGVPQSYIPSYADAYAIYEYEAAYFRNLVPGAGVNRAWMPSALPAPLQFGIPHHHIIASVGAPAPYGMHRGVEFGAPSLVNYTPRAATHTALHPRVLPPTAVEATPNLLPWTAQRWDNGVDAAQGPTPPVASAPRAAAQPVPRPQLHTVPRMKRKSNFRGVSWQASARKWKVQIRAGGQNHYLGVFNDEERAARIYDDAIRNHFPPGVKKPHKWAGFNIPRNGEERSFKEQHNSSAAGPLTPPPGSGTATLGLERRSARPFDGVERTAVLVPRAPAAVDAAAPSALATGAGIPASAATWRPIVASARIDAAAAAAAQTVRGTSDDSVYT